jgi:hypothetical protein
MFIPRQGDGIRKPVPSPQPDTLPTRKVTREGERRHRWGGAGGTPDDTGIPKLLSRHDLASYQ